MRRALCVLLLAASAGCLEEPGPGPCTAPDSAEAWPDPWSTQVVLSTLRQGDTVTAWGCNVGHDTRWLLERSGSCVGSWTWSVTGPDDDVASHGGPQGHYGQCAGWIRLAPGRGVSQTFDLAPWTRGDTYRISLQVYEQKEILNDAGGGPVQATLVV